MFRKRVSVYNKPHNEWKEMEITPIGGTYYFHKGDHVSICTSFRGAVSERDRRISKFKAFMDPSLLAGSRLILGCGRHSVSGVKYESRSPV
jgi:hypothetical protein